MNLSKSCAFLCIFCKSVKIYHFSIDFIFRQLLLTFGDFFLVTLKLFHLSNRREILPKSFFSLQKKFTEKHSLKNLGYWANSGLFLLIFDLSLIILLGTERLKTLAGFKLGFPEQRASRLTSEPLPPRRSEKTICVRLQFYSPCSSKYNLDAQVGPVSETRTVNSFFKRIGIPQ